jgi:site-specific recombinase XerD
MSSRETAEPFDAAVDEYLASYESFWKAKTVAKYKADLRGLRAWLVASGRPLTTQSLDYATLLAFVAHLKSKPAVRGVWRGHSDAVASAAVVGTPRSLNSVNASMRAIQGFVLWLFEDGRLVANPFARKYKRGDQHPLLPRSLTPTKSATLDDIVALERGGTGRAPIDLRD